MNVMEKHMNKIKTLGTLLFSLSVLSCNFNANVNFENEEKEKENAESTAALMYLELSKKNYDKVTSLFSDSFFKTDSRENFIKVLSNKTEKLGDFQDYKLIEWKTSRTQGTNTNTQYLLVYEVKYSKFKATESLSMLKEGEAIKIIGYHVNSDGF